MALPGLHAWGEGNLDVVLPLALALALSHSGPAGHLMANPNLLDMPHRSAYRDIYRSSVGPELAPDAPAAPTTIYDTGLPAQQVHLVACLDVVAQ